MEGKCHGDSMDKKAPPRAESTCHFGAGLNKSGPGYVFMVSYGCPCRPRHSRRCLAFNFKGDFVKTCRAQNIEHANDIAVHGVTIPPHEYFRVRVFRVTFFQYRSQLFVGDRLLVEVRSAIGVHRDTDVIAL